jgi:hypothetical protein
MIRTMMNSAVHFGGGIVLGVLTIFALKGMADMADTRMSRTTGGLRDTPPPPDSSAGRGFDKAEGI